MPRPISKVIVVVSDAASRRLWLKGLNAAAKDLDNPFGIVFAGAEDSQSALSAVLGDGDVQAVLVNEEAPADQAAATDGAAPRWDAAELVQSLQAARPELGLYVLIDEAQRDHAVHAHDSDAIDGYFIRGEEDWRGWFRIIQAELHEKARTPFYDALREYVLMAKDAWHTPGHSSGDSLRGSPWVNDFHEFLGDNVLRADLSVSVDMLDSLLDPKGVIAQAQDLAARAFGAKRTFFATNGTSTANKVIFQTLLTPGDKLLLDRNCHKSVHHGVVLSGALPVYLNSSVNRKYGLFGPVPKAVLMAAIADNPDAKALILTSCTYDGLRYDLRPIVQAAHDVGIKVIVDEAWSAHARFHPALRPTALEAGADYVTQSTHKVLSALSQASMIHVNDDDFEAHLFRENFNMHTSTSPQYSIIASLDVGRRQAMMEGYKLLERALQLARELREAINATGVFHALELEDLLPVEVRKDGIALDPTKVTMDISRSGYTIDEFQRVLFERFNIQVEKSTFNTVTLLLTIGTTRSKVSRLHDALLRLAKESKAPRRRVRAPEIAEFTALRVLPRDAFYCRGELLPLLDDEDRPNAALVGRVCADQIVPYPPGIPALVPGQEITAEIVQFLLGLQRAHKRTDLHGVVYDGYVACLRVMTAREIGQSRQL
jgi:arginine decarboxylase